MQDITNLTPLHNWVKRNQILVAVAIFFTALAVRYFVYSFSAYSFLGVDERSYLRGAKKIIGGSYGETFFMPGWFFVLSSVMRLSIDVRFFMMVVGSISCSLLFVLGQRHFSSVTALLAALLLCFYPEHYYYSHYVQAEIFMEFILIIGAMILFWNRDMKPSRLHAFGCFFLGVGFLFKHFAIIPFAAFLFMSIEFNKEAVKRSAIGLILFLMPISIYSVSIAQNGNDPFFFLNSPIKSVKEWSRNRASGRFEPEERKSIFTSQVQKLLRPEGIKYIKRNFDNLWTPNSLAITRLAFGHYSTAFSIRHTMVSHALFYTFILVTGLAGLCLTTSFPLRNFAVLNLVFLSGMSVIWFLVSRYRLPYMHLLILFSAYFLTNAKPLILNAIQFHRWRLVSFVILMLVVIRVYGYRWHRLGSWY